MENHEQFISALERIGTIIRSLFWEASYAAGLNPIQSQILLFLKHQDKRKIYLSKISQFFGVSMPSLSDTLNSMKQKGLIRKNKDKLDQRIVYISLTKKGKQLLAQISQWDTPLKKALEEIRTGEEDEAYFFLISLIKKLLDQGVIQYLRMCFTCEYFSTEGDGQKGFFCRLLGTSLKNYQLRVDCPDHKSID